MVAHGLADRQVVVVPTAVLLPSDSPRVDGESDEHIRRISEAGGSDVPIVVHRPTMRVIDGMHRLHAAVRNGWKHIEVQFFDGSESDAFVLSVRLNNRNGLPLSRMDRMAAATRIVDSHPHWSDQSIAFVAGISDKTVAAIRQRSTSEDPKLKCRIGRDGKRRPLNATEGRLRASVLIRDNPDLTLREVAKKAEISLGTAGDVRERIRRGENPVPKRFRTEAEPTAETVPPAAEPDDLELSVDVRQCQDASNLHTLLRDPALRSHKEGQLILRLLYMHLRPPQDWDELLNRLPPHSMALLADAARHCSLVWRRIALRLDDLDERTQTDVSEA
nr:StaQ [Kibdelosporangium sp. MJ126-NF4]